MSLTASVRPSTASEDGSSPDRHVSGAGSRLGWVGERFGRAAIVVVVAIASLLIGLHVRAYTMVSPIDELQHIDYMEKASRGHVVARGERIGQYALRSEACRGIDAPAPPIPPCDDPVLLPIEFQEEGYNTASIHPPLYYAASGAIGRLARALPVVDDLITGARLAGALWLSGALALLWLAMADLGVGRAARTALLVILACSPTVLHASATVNPDAMSLLAGSAMLLATLRWESGRWPSWVPIAIAGLAILAKSTNVVAIGAVILYLLASRLATWHRARRARTDLADEVEPASPELGPSIRLVGGLLGAVVLISLVWVIYQGSIALLPNDQIPMSQRFAVDRITPSHIIGQLGAGISPLQAPYIPAVLRTSYVVTAVGVVDAALLAGAVIGAVFGAIGDRRRSIGLAALGSMVVVGPLFVLVNFVFAGAFVQVPSRYGLSIVPMGLAAASVALDRRPLLIAVSCYAVWLVIITVIPLASA